MSACSGCGRIFKISRDALKEAHDHNLNYWGQTKDGPKPTEESTANESFDFCLSCATGEDNPDEFRLPEWIYLVPDYIYKMADLGMTQILHDLECKDVPWHVRNFSELHNHCDANMYGLEVVDALMKDDEFAGWVIEYIAAPAQDIMNSWLEARWKTINKAREKAGLSHDTEEPELW